MKQEKMLLKRNSQKNKELMETKNVTPEISSVKGWKNIFRKQPELKQRQKSGQCEKK